MSQIYDHAGRPMSWDDVHRRVAMYWATHDRDGNPLVVYSALCAHSEHQWCRQTVPCTCWCHEADWLVDPPGRASLAVNARRLERLPVSALGTDSDAPPASISPDGGGAATGATPGRA